MMYESLSYRYFTDTRGIVIKGLLEKCKHNK